MTTLTSITIDPYTTSSKIFGDGNNFFGSLEIADRLGHKTATIIQQIHWWIKDAYHSYDLLGTRFINKTYDELSDYFKITIRTIRRMIKRLEDLNILISIRDTYSFKSYTINYEKLRQFLNGGGGGQNMPSAHVLLSSFNDDSIEKITVHETQVLEKFRSHKSTDFLFTPVAKMATPPYKYIFNTNNRDLSTSIDKTPEEGSSEAVVSFFEKILCSWIISKAQLRSWLQRYGSNYLEDKIALTKKSNPRNPGAFLNLALKLNWQSADKASKAIKQPKEIGMTLPIPTREENIGWYQSLTEKQKLGIFEQACQVWPILELHFSTAKTTPLADNLQDSWVFDLFMEQLGRRKYTSMQEMWTEKKEGVS